jgi:TonB-linked SusC/RagA family outer membrane protein
MKKIRLFLTCLLLVAFSSAYAQSSVTVKGTVTDAVTTEPVSFASIQVKGTMTGATTDALGNYTLKVPSNGILVFSFVGYKTQEVSVNGRETINIALAPETEQLEDVIVVAYGTVKREAKTGSVTSLKTETISSVPVSSVDKLLAGKMAGVMITSQTGQPGASSSIRIRGTSSINAGNEPLWVVDGIPVFNGDQSYFTNTSNAIAAVNPNDIESITVLKDAAAASVYGSRAANGVILVTTKRGKEGRARFNARAKYGVSQLANDHHFSVMTAQDVLAYQRAAVVNAGLDPDNPTGTYYRPMSLLSGTLTNWMKEATTLGAQQEYEINASAGNNKGSYYSSVNYNDNKGVFKGIEYKKLTARVNADYNLTKTLKTGTSVNVAYTNSQDYEMQSSYYSNPSYACLLILPWIRPYNDDGSFNLNIPSNSNTNPLATEYYGENTERQYRFQGNAFLQWSPTPHLTFKTTNAAETTFGEGRRYWNAVTNKGVTNLQTSRATYVNFTTSNTATYTNMFADAHSVRLLLGQEATKYEGQSLYLSSPNVDPDIPYPGTATAADDHGSYGYSAETMLSFFSILDYNYKSRYFLQASARYDGSSVFGANKRWGLFWSVGLSWNINNEEFMKDARWLDLLKLRASYGVNGNNNIGSYASYGVYSSAAYNGVSGMLPATPSNPDLSWERNYSTNIGLDFGFFGRINGSIDVYQRKTADMLLSVPVPQTTGFSSNTRNIGSLYNKGAEFQLSGDIIKSDKADGFNWNVGFNIAYNRSQVADLGGQEFIDNGATRIVVGKQLNTFYLRQYYAVDPTNGEALWKHINSDGTYALTSVSNNGSYDYCGSPEPKFTGGFNTSLTWKGFDLSAFFEFKTGNEVLLTEYYWLYNDGQNMTINLSSMMNNYWKNVGDVGVQPRPVAGSTSMSNRSYNTRFLQRGDYCRLKDLTLSYNLPKNWVNKINLQGVKVYISGLNLYTWHDVDFWDPERGIDGQGVGIYPMTKSFVGGIELSF